MAIKFLSSENIAGDIDVTLSKNGITYLAVTNTNTGASANARVQVVGESAQIDIIATSVGYTGVSGWEDSGVISTDSAASGGLILNSVAGIVKLQTSQTTALTIDNSQNATFAGQVNVNADLKINGSSGEDSLTIAPQAAGSGVFVLSLNAAGSAYEPFRVDAKTYNFTNAGTSVISTSGLDTTFAGDVSMAKLTATKSGTAAVFNSGTTNVVATFTSTDGIASLQCVDSSGNVEFGASGNNFVVQPAGGVAQLSVGSSTSTFAGDITLTPGNSNKIILTPDVNSHYITGNAYWVDVVGNAAEVFRVFGGVGGTSEYFRITGTGAISVGNTGTNYGTSGEVLISNGNTSPTWGAATSVSEDNYYKIDDGLNFYLAFKEGSGTTVADVSGGRNNFTAGVGLDWSETGRFGYAQSFNGSNSYLNGTGPSSNITTFSAWVNNDGDGGIQNIVSGTYIMAYVSIYNNNFSIYDGVGWRNGGAVPANEWVHVAFSYDAAGTSGGLQKMYVNGVLGYSATAVGYTGVSSYISKVGIFTGAIRYFNGEITAIKTWDRILSDSEILAIYNQTALNENLTVLGKVGIGTTSPGTYGPATGTVKLDVLSGDIIRSGFTDPANSWIGFTALPGYNANQYPSVTSKSSLHFANNDKYCAFLEGTDTYFGMLNSASTTKVFFATGSQNSYLAGSGNFGIGVTGPSTKLHVSNAAVINDAYGLALVENTSTGTGSAANSALNIKSKYGTSQFMQWENQGLRIGSRIIDNSSAGNVYFTAGGDSVKMVILAGGEVGIGNTSPSSKLSIGGNAITTLKPTVVIADETNGASLTLRGQSPVLFFDGTAAGVPKILMDGQGIEFKQGTLDSQGAVSFKIDSSGNATFAGDVVAYGSPSDKRLKENIKPIESALDKVSKLQGVTFDWKKSDSILDIKEDIGFIAQDVQKVIPELVRENEDGMLSMRHQGIAPILLEAIKELKAEIEELKKHKCNCKE